MDIRQLRYFITLAETLHFGRAAEMLHISQPPLSRQIAALEQELGVQLIERHSRRAALTHAGQRLLQDARIVLAAFDQTIRNARLAGKGELGELAVGFMMHTAYTVLPGLTRRFVDKYPGIHLELRETLPALLADAILSGRFDAGIMFDPGPTPGLAIRPIHREHLCVALPAGHPLANLEDPVSPQHLRNEPMIAVSVDAAPTLHATILQYCRETGFEPLFRLEAQLQQTIISLVGERLGIALMPDSMRKLGHTGVAFRDLQNAPQIAHVLAWRETNLNPALRPFIAEAEECPASQDAAPGII